MVMDLRDSAPPGSVFDIPARLVIFQFGIHKALHSGLYLSCYFENSLISICPKSLIDFAMNKYYAIPRTIGTDVFRVALARSSMEFP